MHKLPLTYAEIKQCLNILKTNVQIHIEAAKLAYEAEFNIEDASQLEIGELDRFARQEQSKLYITFRKFLSFHSYCVENEQDVNFNPFAHKLSCSLIEMLNFLRGLYLSTYGSELDLPFRPADNFPYEQLQSHAYKDVFMLYKLYSCVMGVMGTPRQLNLFHYISFPCFVKFPCSQDLEEKLNASINIMWAAKPYEGGINQFLNLPFEERYRWQLENWICLPHPDPLEIYAKDDCILVHFVMNLQFDYAFRSFRSGSLEDFSMMLKEAFGTFEIVYEIWTEFLCFTRHKCNEDATNIEISPEIELENYCIGFTIEDALQTLSWSNDPTYWVHIQNDNWYAPYFDLMKLFPSSFLEERKVICLEYLDRWQERLIDEAGEEEPEEGNLQQAKEPLQTAIRIICDRDDGHKGLVALIAKMLETKFYTPGGAADEDKIQELKDLTTIDDGEYQWSIFEELTDNSRELNYIKRIMKATTPKSALSRMMGFLWFLNKRNREPYAQLYPLLRLAVGHTRVKNEPVKKSEFNDECCICYKEFDDTTLVGVDGRIKGECGHIFHRGCIMSWFRTTVRQTCPHCRARFVEEVPE